MALPLVLQKLTKAQHLPAVSLEVLGQREPASVPLAEVEGAQIVDASAREEGLAGWGAQRKLAKRGAEADAASCEAIDVRRTRRCARVLRREVVEDEVEDVALHADHGGRPEEEEL